MASIKSKSGRKKSDGYAPDKINIRLKEGASQNKVQTLLQHLGTLKSVVPELNLYILLLYAGIDPIEAVRESSTLAEIEYAERVALRRLIRPKR